jgi:hypothetical protein
VSTPVVLSARDRVPWYQRPRVQVVVVVAHIIGKMPPRRIRRILTSCAKHARPASYGEAATARQMVVSVSIRCAGEGCVPRSIATALLCRLRGTWPTWNSGVRIVPFLAHAWVEADGRPVDEPATTCQVRPMITVPPGNQPRRRIRLTKRVAPRRPTS